MKVVHFSTSVSESSANTKLHIALQKAGVESSILVRWCDENIEGVQKVNISLLEKVFSKINCVMEKTIIKRYKILSGMPFSLGIFGVDLSKIKEVQEADILHLHWICNFLSPKMIGKLIDLGKPIVWTCHDSWPFTGGCHVRLGCENYVQGCGGCPILGSSKKNDISSGIMRYKMQNLFRKKITFIAPSNWTCSHVRNSLLFGDNKCVVIPNTLNVKVFCARSQEEIIAKLQYNKEKDKIHILFGAVSVNSPYKGYKYLKEMLKILYDVNKKLADKIVLHIVGGAENGKFDVDIELAHYESIFWGYIHDQEKMACLYSMADVLVYPSLEESLGYVVMECLACSTPVVVFKTGGIPDMVEHKKNGYIAERKNSRDLLAGLLWILENNEDNHLGINGRKRIEYEFNEKVIANKHIELYKFLVGENSNEGSF